MLKQFNIQPMLNVYPDSLGKELSGTVNFLSHELVAGSFESVYILPSLYHSDLDRGFSVIDYGLNEQLAQREDLEKLEKLGVNTKLDFILNHASVLSPQFQSVIQDGTKSPYYDFFIDWNQFWQGNGEMTEQGYIQPEEKYIQKMFFRKPGLPILTIMTKLGEQLTFWNTFYQEKQYPTLTTQDWMQELQCQYTQAEIIANKVAQLLENQQPIDSLDLDELNHWKSAVVKILKMRCHYLGQMDLNIQSPLVWEFYRQTLATLKGYGASIVRLDAFAYAPKEVGERNFLNEPATWDLLKKVNHLAQEFDLTVLPEIHESYETKIYEKIAGEGYLTYDFFLPGLILDTIEGQSAKRLVGWINEIKEKHIMTVNMLGCHDGIPLLDLKGILPEKRIQELIQIVVQRGGYVKNLHGQENVYYQVNATYFSALGEDEQKMRVARAIQLFTPGKPQIWYLDIFVGKNDYDAVKRAGAGGHKEINRTNLTHEQMEDGLKQTIVKEQLELIRFRYDFPAFNHLADVNATCQGSQLMITWQYQGSRAELTVDLMRYESLSVKGYNTQGETVFEFKTHV